MDLYHSITEGEINITNHGDLWAVHISNRDYGYWYVHEWSFVSEGMVFAYIDWCDMYCDRVIHDLLFRE